MSGNNYFPVRQVITLISLMIWGASQEDTGCRAGAKFMDGWRMKERVAQTPENSEVFIARKCTGVVV